MDSKRLIVMMVVSLAVLLGWNYFIMNQAKRNNWDMGRQAKSPETQVTERQPTLVESTTPATQTVTTQAAPMAQSQFHVLTMASESPAVELGSTQFKDPVWSMGMAVTSRGAAIDKVTLTEFPRSDELRDQPYVFQGAEDSVTASMATSYAAINGQRVMLSNANWQLVKHSDTTATFAVEIGETSPAVRITKQISIEPRIDSQTNKISPRQGYEATVRHQIQNLSNQPIEVELGIAGPTLPPREVERGPDRRVIAGYNKNFQYPKTSIIESRAWPLESLYGDSAKMNVITGEKDRPLIWLGLSSTYFDAIVLPVSADPSRTAEFLRSVQVRGIGGNEPKQVIGAEVLFQTKALNIAPGGAQAFDLTVFMGPKARATVNNDYYSAYPREYKASLSTSGSCAYCTFQPLVNLMVWLLRVFHMVLFDWGLAIIALVIMVRALMHPLTRKSTVSMHRMSKLAPEMERIKKKYADNPDEQQRAMMAFYKEHGAGQLFGCLPMFIQMPIWIALWSALSSTFELRLAPFLWGFTWIDDLARPDRLISFTPINLFFFHLDAINLLPLGMAVVFFLQQHYTPKPASATPEQAQQQKMMQWMMVLLFPLMLYNGPSGLNLYIFTSTAVGMMESKWIRDHLRAREAAEAAAGPTFIDVPATKARNKGEPERHDEPAKPKGRIGQFIERMQKLAADAQRQAQQQQRPKKK